jgi:endonuclease/exonuclease/phosphatase family metal-dependent hydrolase
MRTSNLAVLIVMLAAGAIGGCAKDVPLRVMTFNIRTATEADGPHQWEHRRDAVAAMLTDRRPDVLGVQEARKSQIDDLVARLGEDYAWVGEGRDGSGRGEFCPIFYHPAKLKLRDHGTFWVSESPSEPSVGWDAAFPRIATWAKFADRHTGREFLVLNTHLDHKGVRARTEGAKLLIERLSQLSNGLPVILTADLNRRPDSDVYLVMTETLRDVTRARDAGHSGPSETFTGWLDRPRPASRPAATLDYILVSPSVRVRWTQTLPSEWGGRQMSDHRAVMADLNL